MDLIEKYLGEGREVVIRGNKLQKLIRNKLYSVSHHGYSMDSGFHAALDDENQAKQLAKDMEMNFKIKTKIKKIGNSWVVMEKDKKLSNSVKYDIKNPIFKK